MRVGLPPQTLEVNAEVGGGLVTQFEVFFQGLVENLFQFWRQLWIEFQWRDGGAVENRVEHRSTCRTGKRGSSRGHFVQNDPQRKQVGASVQLLAHGLLWGHVGNGSDRHAGTG